MNVQLRWFAVDLAGTDPGFVVQGHVLQYRVKLAGHLQWTGWMTVPVGSDP